METQSSSSNRSGKLGMFRMLAREEQKKLAKLKASGAGAKEIAAAEARLKHLTARLAEGPQKSEFFSSSKSKEVHLFDELSEEELRGIREKRPEAGAAALCAVCREGTTRSATTGSTRTYFCSAACQRKGWATHLERSRKQEKEDREWRDVAKAAKEQDDLWEKQTKERLLEEDQDLDVDFLGNVRGKCARTGCRGYVQRRGAPRNIDPTYRDGRVEASGVWAWNRVDHLACRRCGAPADDHDNLTDDLKTRNRQATATKLRRSNANANANAARKPLASEYYYATAGVVQGTTRPPQKLRKKEKPEHDDDDDDDDDDATQDGDTIDANSVKKKKHTATATAHTKQSLAGLSVKDLKLLCVRSSVSVSGLVEKDDIVNHLLQHFQRPAAVH